MFNIVYTHSLPRYLLLSLPILDDFHRRSHSQTNLYHVVLTHVVQYFDIDILFGKGAVVILKSEAGQVFQQLVAVVITLVVVRSRRHRWEVLGGAEVGVWV